MMMPRMFSVLSAGITEHDKVVMDVEREMRRKWKRLTSLVIYSATKPRGKDEQLSVSRLPWGLAVSRLPCRNIN